MITPAFGWLFSSLEPTPTGSFEQAPMLEIDRTRKVWSSSLRVIVQLLSGGQCRVAGWRCPTQDRGGGARHRQVVPSTEYRVPSTEPASLRPNIQTSPHPNILPSLFAVPAVRLNNVQILALGDHAELFPGNPLLQTWVDLVLLLERLQIIYLLMQPGHLRAHLLLFSAQGEPVPGAVLAAPDGEDQRGTDHGDGEPIPPPLQRSTASRLSRPRWRGHSA